MVAPLRIGIVAGEGSGDILGASLVRSLKQQHPDLVVEGIGGPRMIAEGCRSFFPMDRLSVMGIIEPLKRLPELLRIRHSIKQYFLRHPPDVFIGIDSPDFTLHIEKFLRSHGIRTVHYVSPSVWAWRQGRIHHIQQCVDHMLTLFPFELAIYRQYNIPATFVGHPLADEFPMECNTAAHRNALGLSPGERYVAVLPGSRENEVAMLAPVFIETMQRCAAVKPELHFLLPAANAARRQQLEHLLAAVPAGAFRYTLYEGRSHDVMGASELVLMASGTTTLEAMLLKKPMVVAYKLAPLTYAIARFLVNTPYFSLPNLLAQEKLVPELLQHDANAGNLAQEVLTALDDKQRAQQLARRFEEIHRQLQCQAGDRAAQAVLGVVGIRRPS